MLVAVLVVRVEVVAAGVGGVGGGGAVEEGEVGGGGGEGGQKGEWGGEEGADGGSVREREEGRVEDTRRRLSSEGGGGGGGGGRDGGGRGQRGECGGVVERGWVGVAVDLDWGGCEGGESGLGRCGKSHQRCRWGPPRSGWGWDDGEGPPGHERRRTWRGWRRGARTRDVPKEVGGGVTCMMRGDGSALSAAERGSAVSTAEQRQLGGLISLACVCKGLRRRQGRGRSGRRMTRWRVPAAHRRR